MNRFLSERRVSPITKRLETSAFNHQIILESNKIDSLCYKKHCIGVISMSIALFTRKLTDFLLYNNIKTKIHKNHSYLLAQNTERKVPK
jgi:hypothetical protein